MSRKRPDGTVLEWVIQSIGGHELGGLVPFYIDWLQCPHPADTSPVVGKLVEFRVTTANEVAMAQLVANANGVRIAEGAAALHATFESPKGRVAFRTASPEGFRI